MATTHAPEAYEAPQVPIARLSGRQLTALSVLWLGLQFFWTSQQLMVMPRMVELFVAETEKHWYLGLIKGFGAAMVLLAQLTMGFLSDHAVSRLGRRRPFILYGISSGCLAVVFFMLAPSYWWMFAAYMLIEATVNAASVPFQSLLPDLVPESQHAQAGNQMALNHLSGNLVSLIAILAMVALFGDGQLLVFGHLKPAGFILWLLPLYIVLLVGTMLIVVFGIDEHAWAQHARAKVSGAVARLRVLPGTIVEFPRTAGTLLGCMVQSYRGVDLRGRPDFNWLMLSRFVINFGYHTFLTFVAYFISANLDVAGWAAGLGLELGESTLGFAALALVLMGFIVGGLIGNRLSAPFAQRRGKKAVITGGIIIAGLAFIPLIVTHDVWTAAALGTLVGAGWGAFLSSDWAFACTLMSGRQAGSFMGIWDATTLLPQIFAPMIGGALMTVIQRSYGSELGTRGAQALGHQWLFATIIVYFVIGLLLLRPVREQRPRVV